MIQIAASLASDDSPRQVQSSDPGPDFEVKIFGFLGPLTGWACALCVYLVYSRF